MKLNELQYQVASWSKANFKRKKPYQPLLGLCEEVGELCHAHLKSEQKIRGSIQQHFNAKVDAVGDVVIYLADYCNNNGINLDLAVSETWKEVKNRNWVKNKKDGKV